MTEKISHKMITTGALAISMGLMAGAAQATFNDCSGGGSGNPNCFNWKFNNTLTNTQGNITNPYDPGVTATASGWANTVGSANVLLESAYITQNGSSGLGVRNNDCTGYSNCTAGLSGSGLDGSEGVSPEHAMDNNDRVDSIMFTFSEKVNLSSFSAGWVQTDSDYSVLAYTGSGAPTLAGLSYSQLLSNGWSLIGNYTTGTGNGCAPTASCNNSIGTGAHDFANNTYSSYWLIGALNTFVGGDAAKAGNDYFKLISLAGCTCDNAPPGTPGCGGGGGGGVPEPGTLLLMSAGFIGLARINRRRQVVAT
jgi:hypothetical protein